MLICFVFPTDNDYIWQTLTVHIIPYTPANTTSTSGHLSRISYLLRHVISTPETLIHCGQKWCPPGSARSRTVWKSQPHRQTTEWPGLVGPARHGEGKVLLAGKISIHTPTSATHRGPPRRYRRAWFEKFNSGYTVTGWGSWSRRSPLIGGKKVQQFRTL